MCLSVVGLEIPDRSDGNGSLCPECRSIALHCHTHTMSTGCVRLTEPDHWSIGFGTLSGESFQIHWHGAAKGLACRLLGVLCALLRVVHRGMFDRMPWAVGWSCQAAFWSLSASCCCTRCV